MSPEGGEYLVGDGLSIGEMDTNKMISYQEAVILSMEAMSSMKGAEEGASFLLPEGWGRFWTEHSERSTLSSALASLGIVKSDRDLLGRWSPEGSDQYTQLLGGCSIPMQMLFEEEMPMRGWTKVQSWRT